MIPRNTSIKRLVLRKKRYLISSGVGVGFIVGTNEDQVFKERRDLDRFQFRSR